MGKEKGSRFLGICCKYIFPLILLLYPLRHISWGLDLWDTGYNYANFRYMGVEHMDSMWLFSTYLANVAGHFLTLLPGGHTLLFMNLYTGLFVSALALMAYFFCIKRLQMSPAIVFLGVFTAVSLCWCPTALLYNYLTYVLFLAGVMLLYEGLTQDKSILLILAGAALGTNIFVRFSNLPEMGLIAAVWAYGIICKKKPGRVVKETLACFAGYAGAVLLWLLWISLRYGFAEYVEGISRLFAMTDTATDYQATSMLYGIYLAYRKNLYWLVGLLCFGGIGTFVCMCFPKKWKKAYWIVGSVTAVAAFCWLYFSNSETRGRFCSLHFDEYNAMLIPGIVFLMFTMLTAGIRILQPGVEKHEKLIAGMIILVILLTSIGSNNGLFPSINNLFLAIPYMLTTICKLCLGAPDLRFPVVWRRFTEEKNRAEFGAATFGINIVPIKAVCVMFLVVFLFQSIGFGTGFVFVEAAGAKNIDTKVENNAILKGIRMSSERAEWMSEISAYVTDKGLTGREVILYGQIPALSFYLELPSAFNPWSDLRSYSKAALEAALAEVETEMAAGGMAPVVILDKKLIVYAEGGEAALIEAGYAQSEVDKVLSDTKLYLIWEYIERNGYVETFSNNKFVLFETEKRAYD